MKLAATATPLRPSSFNLPICFTNCRIFSYSATVSVFLPGSGGDWRSSTMSLQQGLHIPHVKSLGSPILHGVKQDTFLAIPKLDLGSPKNIRSGGIGLWLQFEIIAKESDGWRNTKEIFT